MTSCETWDSYRGLIRSYNGGWRIGEGVYCHGYNIMEELVGNISYMQMLILNATGKLVCTELSDWFEARQICMSWPDPRIWCNQVGALAGSARTSAAAATTAGVLASDSHAYGGPRTAISGASFIRWALKEYLSGMTVQDIVEQNSHANHAKPKMMGYARPIAKGDERIPAMIRVSQQLGFSDGPHLQLAWQIERYLLQHYDESMNMNGYSSAFLADQGLTGYEISCISTSLVASGVTACYVDTMKRPAGTFNALRCDDIVYTGPAVRRINEHKEE